MRSIPTNTSYTCDYCSQSMSQKEFTTHVRMCKLESILPRSSPEDSENYIERHVHKSSQISGKLSSLRTFLEDNAFYDDCNGDDIMDDCSQYIKVSDRDQVCPICLNNIYQRNARTLHVCKHTFCDKCIHTWVAYKKECPVCKQNLF